MGRSVKRARVAKVMCGESGRQRLSKDYPLIEQYEGFVVLRVGRKELEALAARYPLEDITEQYGIRVGEHVIDTSVPRIDAQGKVHAHPAYEQVEGLLTGRHHYLVQFVGPIKKSWLTRIRRAGGETRAPYSTFTYVVRADEQQVARIVALPFVRWVGHLSHRHRVQTEAAQGKRLPRTRSLAGVYEVEFFDKSDMRPARRDARKLGLKVTRFDESARTMVVDLSEAVAEHRDELLALAEVHGVAAIRKRAFKRPSNDVAARIIGAHSARRAPASLTGAGEIIAVCDTGLDTGDPGAMHPDFAGRVLAIKSYPITPDYDDWIRNRRGDSGPADLDSGHGTHVAGSALGAGQEPGGAGRGIAPRAKLVFQAVEQEVRWKSIDDTLEQGRYQLAGIPADLGKLFGWARRKGARIHTNSWGGGDPGEYDAHCRQLDEFVWRHRDFTILVAAGNDGTDADRDGVIDPMSVTSPATAKNCITVGASENQRPEFNHVFYGGWWPGDYPVPPPRFDPMADDPCQVVAFSSRGPTIDGRIKPDVVAPGTFILSSRSRLLAENNYAWAQFTDDPGLYLHMGGTSMATPLVAGTAALLRQFLRRDVRIRNPSAAMIKACLIAGAVRLPGHPLPDRHQGYGRVDIGPLVTSDRFHFFDDERGLDTGQVDTFPFRVRSSRTPLRVALAYTDYPGPALVNNLNLMLTDPGGLHHTGNGAGTLVPDAVNNTEVIDVARPRVGKWTLRVIASNVPHGRQPYALVAGGRIDM